MPKLVEPVNLDEREGQHAALVKQSGSWAVPTPTVSAVSRVSAMLLTQIKLIKVMLG